MDIWPIDFNKTLQEISEWFDKWRVERFGSNSLNPERYYKVTPDEKGRYLYGVAEGDSLNEEKAKCDKVLWLLLSIKQINDKLNGKALSQHLQWREQEQLKEERETLYKAFLDEVQTEPEQAAPEPQPEETNNVVLPVILNIDRVKDIFSSAINMGWMQPDGKGGYKWIGFGDQRGRVQQCVYMCGQIFGYKKGKSGNDGANIPCKELEKLFGVVGLYSRLIKCWEAKPQIWREPIDEMIKKVTKNTSK